MVWENIGLPYVLKAGLFEVSLTPQVSLQPANYKMAVPFAGPFWQEYLHSAELQGSVCRKGKEIEEIPIQVVRAATAHCISHLYPNPGSTLTLPHTQSD